ncbi:MAG: ATP:cob(I)alamin adenosyltransferase [Bdellovibrio sp. CG10_big_fil_rev_8_21_14_0_10_47_8]|nr:MAG: ATP:cob(I)alamin adenosyltransferase [Bdellovibrio sp. CG10_big_fil_rev_8_21_14_0_10_47_8]
MKTKIYTKTGDQGQTRLVDGRECSKASDRVESYGTVDELNSVLGLVHFDLQNSQLTELASTIFRIQNELFNLGSHLACENEELRKKLPSFDEDRIEQLEKAIDQMTEELPPLTNFILPGGGLGACHLHLARTVCRRGERSLVRLLDRLEPNKSSSEDLMRALRYLNRLSDFLFVAARWTNFKLQISDVLWQKNP